MLPLKRGRGGMLCIVLTAFVDMRLGDALVSLLGRHNTLVFRTKPYGNIPTGTPNGGVE